MSTSDRTSDPEKDGDSDYAHLENGTVTSFSWNNVNVEFKKHVSDLPTNILTDVSGHIEAGEVLALMGPRQVIVTFARSLI